MAKTRTKKERALFALLALRNGRVTDREWAARMLWPESGLEQSRANLRRSLCDLGKALGIYSERLETHAGELSFNFSNAWIDVGEFDRAVTNRSPISLKRAVQLHHSPLLSAFDDDWALAERSNRLETYFGIVEALSLWIEPREGIVLMENALKQDPANEKFARRLIELYAASGAPGAGLAAFNAWVERLHKEFGTRPSAETVELANQLRTSHRSLDKPTPPVAIPLYGTHFFGRESEIIQIALALKEKSGVALTGLPGVGKTRLAAEAAQALTSDFSDGVYFLECGRTTFQSFIERCASLLGIGDSRTPEAISSFLRRRRILLVVDDIDSELPLIGAFLSNLTGTLCRCRVLTTSRLPLHLPDVYQFHVRTLDSKGDVSDLPSPAAKLFEDRARLVTPEFILDRYNAQSVEAICRKLDGIPLAIEIAAAWTESLPLSTIDSRLGVRLARQTVPSNSRSRRETTLASAFEECLEHLTLQELQLLRHLAPFEDGWTLDAAVAVSGLPETQTLVALGGLVQKSLVSLQHQPERYRMLDTTREIALSGVGEAEAEQVFQKVADYYCDLILDLDSDPDRYFEDRSDDGLTLERRNLENAVSWWQSRDPHLAMRLRFLLFHWQILPIDEVEWIDWLARDELPSEGLEPIFFTCVGFSALWLAHPETLNLLNQAVHFATIRNEPQWEAHAQNAVSIYYQRQGLFSESLASARACEAAARKANMPFFVELSINSRCYVSWVSGDPTAEIDLTKQLRRGQVTGNWRARYAALRGLCAISMESGNFDSASRYCRGLTPLAREHCQHELTNILIWNSIIERSLNAYFKARAALDEALEISSRRKTPEREAAILSEFSLLAEQEGNLEEAESYLSKVTRIVESRNSSRALYDVFVRRAELALVMNLPDRAQEFADVAYGVEEEYDLRLSDQDRSRLLRIMQKLSNPLSNQADL